jgi:phytoene synthase
MAAAHPGSGPLVPISQNDRALTRRFIAMHSKSFYLSSLLLPRKQREEAWALYAFCRHADDSVDGVNAGDGQIPLDAPTEESTMLARVQALRARLQSVYASHPGAGDACAIDRSFFAVATRTGLPQAVPERLLRGMEMDARGTRYHDWAELLGYCFNVAGTVGLMMTYVMGHVMPEQRRTEVLLRACDLGVAMQLSNIARDVGEDARRGRVYLPDDLLARHGLDAAAVLQLGRSGEPSPPPLCAAVAELLQRADSHYPAAALGVTMLPPPSRLAIRSALLIYSAIGARLAAQGHDALRTRAYLPLSGKLVRVLRAWLRGLRPALQRAPATPTRGPADELLTTLCREVGVI